MVLQQLEKHYGLTFKKRGRINRMEKIDKKRNFIRKKVKLMKILENKFQIN